MYVKKMLTIFVYPNAIHSRLVVLQLTFIPIDNYRNQHIKQNKIFPR